MPTNELRILLIEDNPADADLIAEYLEDTTITGYKITHVTNLSDGLKNLENGQFDVILLDLSLPDAFGMEGPNRTIESASGTPIIVLTGNEDERLAVDAISHGIQDYLVKNYLNEYVLGRSMLYAVERKKSEIEIATTRALLFESARFESIGKMAAGIGHDLNNIFSGVKMFNQLINKTNDINKVKEFSTIQKESIQFGINLVGNLLSFSRAQKKEYKDFDPVENLKSILGILLKRIEQNSITISTDFGQNLIINGDSGQFSQICMNLIINASDAMKNGGNLSLSLVRNGDFIDFNCKDEGEGIPKDKIATIFDLLFTTKEEGSGIGLYISNKIVTEAGGFINVTSEINKGAEFTVSLPEKWNIPE